MAHKKKIGVVIFLGSIVTFFGGAMYLQSNNFQKNYQPVEAVITETEIKCFVKSRNSKSNGSSTNGSYLSCNSRRRASLSVKQRVTATYRYISPVDGQEYAGQFMREGRRKADELPVGKTIPVFASKSEPSVSMTSEGNMFVDNQFEI